MYTNTLEYASYYQFPPFVNGVYTRSIFNVPSLKLKTNTETYTGPNNWQGPGERLHWNWLSYDLLRENVLSYLHVAYNISPVLYPPLSFINSDGSVYINTLWFLFWWFASALLLCRSVLILPPRLCLFDCHFASLSEECYGPHFFLSMASVALSDCVSLLLCIALLQSC